MKNPKRASSKTSNLLLNADLVYFSWKCSDNESTLQDKQLVLLDARNLYETRIGKFDAPNVETLDPGIRQYSDLPSWIDDNSEELRGKKVLM